MTRVTEAVEEADRLRQLASDLTAKLTMWHDAEHPADPWGRPCRCCGSDATDFGGVSTDALLARARSELGLS